MKLEQLVVGFTALMAAAMCAAQTPPAGWRFFQTADTTINDERVSLPMTKVAADFNGDGESDTAAVLVYEQDANRAGVFVFSTNATQSPSAEKLDEYPFSNGEFMLSVVNKGCYHSEKRSVCLAGSGLLRTEIEYGWGTLYWQESGKWQKIHFTRGEFEGL